MKPTLTIITALLLAAGFVGSVIAQPPKPNINTKVSLNEFVHPPVNFKPGLEYGPDARKYQGIPGIERAPGGRLWATWYAGRVWEDQFNYVVTATSGDDGKTWSEIKFVIDPDGDGPRRASDPCLWLDPDGRLWLFWWVNGPDDFRGITMAVTTDNPDVETPQWSTPHVICTGVMLNKPVVTRDGDWLLPTAIWQTEGSCRSMVSVDKGKTWTLGGTANVPKDRRECEEPMIVERRDGSLWQLARTRFGIAQSVSKDGGRTWTEFTDYLPHAVSRFFFRRLASGNLLLVKHGPLDRKTDRSHLTAYLSKDDGATWQGGLVLDERGVSYPDGTQSPDGTIRVVYDYGRAGGKHILMAVFTEADVLAGKFASAAARPRVLINKATGINPTTLVKANPDGKPMRKTKPGTLVSADIKPEKLRPFSKLFKDRAYYALGVMFYDSDSPFTNMHFLPIAMEGQKTIKCERAGTIYFLTPGLKRSPDSTAQQLMDQGFEKVALKETVLFDDSPATFCTIFQKDCAAGETILIGKWAVPLFFP